MDNAKLGIITKVSGPLIIAEGLEHADMFDVVRVGKDRLIGEIIEMRGGKASIQVYEETAGIGPGDTVESTGAPLSVELGPGIIENIYDGIQRPLEGIRAVAGNTIKRGVEVPALNREKKWHFQPIAQVGDEVTAGDFLGSVKETVIVDHKIMVPYGISGTVTKLTEGDYTVEEVIGQIKDEKGNLHDITLMQKWPVRQGRPYKEKLSPDIPM